MKKATLLYAEVRNSSGTIGFMGRRESIKHKTLRTSIGLKRTTKDSLDHNKSPGQSYDGFLRQLIALWERMDRQRFRDS